MVNTELKETGGARIGNANATWPLATLTVTSGELQLKASLIGSLNFLPGDIISIEPYVQIPFLGQGIKINHRVAAYKSKVIFWTFVPPAQLISRIEETGFLKNVAPLSPQMKTEITALQSSGGFPLKPGPAIAIVVLWNILFLMDILGIFPNSKNNRLPLGTGAQLALAMVFVTGLLLLINEPFRRFILKPNRTLADIKSFVYFLLFITGVMFIGIAFVPH